ncbi:methyl-accepting chemotaxis protein, partial [Achromobacter denitrificans]
EEAAAAAGSLQEQAQRLAEAVSVFKINAGEVIEVPARQLAQQRPAPRVSAPAPAAPQAPVAETPAAPKAAPAARLTHTARAKPAAAEGATAARPLRRPAARPAAAPAKPAPAASRRSPPADDDWESF